MLCLYKYIYYVNALHVSASVHSGSSSISIKRHPDPGKSLWLLQQPLKCTVASNFVVDGCPATCPFYSSISFGL